MIAWFIISGNEIPGGGGGTPILTGAGMLVIPFKG